jgi:hypothetical protein
MFRSSLSSILDFIPVPHVEHMLCVDAVSVFAFSLSMTVVVEQVIQMKTTDLYDDECIDGLGVLWEGDDTVWDRVWMRTRLMGTWKRSLFCRVTFGLNTSSEDFFFSSMT